MSLGLSACVKACTSDCQEAGIDLAFLEALPPELRAEVLSAHGAKMPDPAPAAAAAQPAAAPPAEAADAAGGAAGEVLLAPNYYSCFVCTLAALPVIAFLLESADQVVYAAALHCTTR